MKKSLLSILIFTFFSSYSQISFGPKIGYILSDNYYFQQSEIPTKAKSSYYFGGFLEYKIKNIGIGSEITYANLGSTIEQTSLINGSVIRSNTTTTLKQINLCLTLRYYIINKISISAGGYFGNILSVEYKNDKNYNFTYYNSDYYNNTDFGLAFGFEYNLYKGLFFETRYNLGLKDISNFKETIFSNDFDPVINGNQSVVIKNRFLSIGMGYRFN